MSARYTVGADVPLDRRAAREAAQWLAYLESGQATVADIRACDQWRADHAEHERAWQRAQALTSALGLIPPKVGMATLGRSTGKSRRAVLKALVTLAVTSPAAWAAWRSAPAVRWRADYRTAVGERREWLLADGSRLWLNTTSAIDQTLTETRHVLLLRAGEIYVEAATPPGPALHIQTRLGTIHAAASSCVAVRLDDRHCLVNVVAGQVTLQSATETARRIHLTASQRAAFDAATAYRLPSSPPHAPDWLQGTLHADAMRLDTFAAELARHRPGVVRCDPDVADLRISGAFQLDNTDRVLQALPALLPVQVTYRTAYWVTLEPANAHA